MLDGWFIIQDKKRKKEQAEKQLEDNTRSEKIKQASEVFVMAKSKEDVQNIHSMNDAQGQAIRKQREALVKQKGTVEQHEFFDERVDQTNRQVQKYKDKFRS
jgi:phosphopantetheine adenylyltransferase